MYRFYPREWLEELKRQVNLVDIVSQFTRVERFGRNYLAICPFHDDKGPSLQINPDTNTFYCHGCGAGSKNHSRVRTPDPISFVMNVANLTFEDAIQYLVKYTNLQLPQVSKEEQLKLNQHQAWIMYCQEVNQRFHQQLYQNEKAMMYLANRAITPLEIEIWKLGFGDDLNKEFVHTKGRIVFPIFDYYGDIVSFTGRVPYSQTYLDQVNEQLVKMGKKKQPKYKERPGFNKGDHLYGIHLAKDRIRETRTAYLTEGYLDVISLHKHHIENAVSTMGTALTDNQVKLLKRAGAESVILMRDGDLAGLLAAERDAKILAQHGLKTYIVPLESNMDPDDLCRQYGLFDDSLHMYISKHTQTIEQWKLNRIYKETQDEILYHYNQINIKQSERMEKVLEVLATVDDPIQLDSFIHQVSDLYCVSYEAVKNQLKRIKSFADTSQSLTKVI